MQKQLWIVMDIRTGIGQDSHRFESQPTGKKCIIGGILFESTPALQGNSDADVVLHAITNAISGVTGINILGNIADKMCKRGITDSSMYLKKALEFLREYRINNLSVSIECKTPKISPRIEEIKISLSEILKIEKNRIGITATTGESLTAFGRGEGIQCFAVVTVIKI